MTTSALGVRRAKAAFFSGCKSHPATIVPAGSNRSSHGGIEVAEAFGIACHALVSLDFRCGSRLCKNADTETNCATIESGRWRGRLNIGARAEVTTQYFVSVSKNLFLHSLDPQRKSRLTKS